MTQEISTSKPVCSENFIVCFVQTTAKLLIIIRIINICKQYCWMITFTYNQLIHNVWALKIVAVVVYILFSFEYTWI